MSDTDDKLTTKSILVVKAPALVAWLESGDIDDCVLLFCLEIVKSKYEVMGTSEFNCVYFDDVMSCLNEELETEPICLVATSLIEDNDGLSDELTTESMYLIIAPSFNDEVKGANIDVNVCCSENNCVTKSVCLEIISSFSVGVE